MSGILQIGAGGGVECYFFLRVSYSVGLNVSLSLIGSCYCSLHPKTK